MSRRLVLPALVLSLAIAASASAQTTDTLPTYGAPASTTAQAAHHQRAPARMWLTELQGVDSHSVKVGHQFEAIGRIAPYVPHQKVQIRVGHNGHILRRRWFKVTQIGHTGVGRFHMSSPELIRPGPFRVVASHKGTPNQAKARVVSSKVGVHYPDLDPGDSGSDVSLFASLLRKVGYYAPHGSSYGSNLGLAVLAFRKENGMDRTTNATPSIFRTLAKHRGGFKLRYPGAGKHVEVDISKQTMALANHGKAQYIFHVSTGAPATPTITGHYSIYQKTPGRLPDGMYYSSFWHNGYAIHGYPEVPTYNASHGCVRVPEVFAIFIYDWLPVGTDVYTYY
jgi:L,D-transpeptidase catalytic domain